MFLPIPRDFDQLVRGCVEYGRQAAESVDQTVGQRIDVYSGKGVKKHKLQNIVVIKVFEPVLCKAMFHPLPMPVMDAHNPSYLAPYSLRYRSIFSTFSSPAGRLVMISRTLMIG